MFNDSAMGLSPLRILMPPIERCVMLNRTNATKPSSLTRNHAGSFLPLMTHAAGLLHLLHRFTILTSVPVGECHVSGISTTGLHSLRSNAN